MDCFSDTAKQFHLARLPPPSPSLFTSRGGGGSSYCLKNAEGRHSFMSARSVTRIPV